jgi:hypothetical protein
MGADLNNSFHQPFGLWGIKGGNLWKQILDFRLGLPIAADLLDGPDRVWNSITDLSQKFLPLRCSSIIFAEPNSVVGDELMELRFWYSPTRSFRGGMLYSSGSSDNEVTALAKRRTYKTCWQPRAARVVVRILVDPVHLCRTRKAVDIPAT